MMYNFLILFILFITYSTIGWMIELVAVSIEKKKLVKNRGFLIGPYCPIYGFSSVLMLIFLNKYEDDPWVLFVMAILLCTTVEYLTSYVMEKLFKVRWWDYSHIRFNINGRVCLTNSVLFGALGLFLIYILNPFVLSKYLLIPKTVFIVIAVIILILFISDVIVSLEIICKIKVTADNIRKDCTEEITKKVKEILEKKSFLSRRIFNAFPKITVLENISKKIRKKTP